MTWQGRGSTRASRKTRLAVLARANYRCQIRGPHCTGTATEDDHMQNIATGGHTTDLTNRQAACTTCHSEKTQRESNAGYTPRKRPPEQHPGLIK